MAQRSLLEPNSSHDISVTRIFYVSIQQRTSFFCNFEVENIILTPSILTWGYIGITFVVRKFVSPNTNKYFIF